jgi:D-arabinose 1-dehydrogenase-like Zn-dependent alcohol dehydrogenase
VKFAVALGAEVTAISTKESKAEEAKKLGAHHFLVSSNPEVLKAAAGTFDFLLCCAGGDNMDFSSFFSLLDKNGKFVMVGITAKPITINLLPFIMKQISLSGSCHGSPDIVEEMLQLASKHNILADVETMPLEKADEALQGVREGKPKFRYVLKIEQ